MHAAPGLLLAFADIAAATVALPLGSDLIFQPQKAAFTRKRRCRVPLFSSYGNTVLAALQTEALLHLIPKSFKGKQKSNYAQYKEQTIYKVPRNPNSIAQLILQYRLTFDYTNTLKEVLRKLCRKYNFHK